MAAGVERSMGRWLIVLLVSVCCAAAIDPAAAQRRAAAAAPRPESLTPEESVLQARQAMQKDDLERFDQFATRAAEHPVGALYAPYWRLRIRLNRNDGDPALLDREVDRFVGARAGTLIGDLARRDWMLNLGRRGEFARLESQYDKWVLQDDGQVHCYRMAARALRGDKVADAARDLLAQTRDLGSACATLVETLLQTRQFDRDDLWRTMRSALEYNSAGSIRRLGQLMALDDGGLDAAIERPLRALAASSGGRELDVIALSRLARGNPQGAAERLATVSLPARDKAFVAAQIAASSMRKLEPEALTLTRGDALAAEAGDETWVWLARAALRGQDWRTLLAVIDKMSADGRRDPAWVYWRARALAATGRKEMGDALLKTIAGQHHSDDQLANEELGALTIVPATSVNLPGDADIAAFDGNEGFARAIALYGVGLRFEGNREWNWQLRGLNDRQLLAAASWACRRQILDRCVNTAERTVADHDFSLRFISPFVEQLKPVAIESGLDPAWVYGLIRQESRFIMDARSSAGAQGLMQMMPATARWVARKMGVSDFRIEQLNELPTNLRFGTFYLKSVSDDLEGSPLLASAAYNAGPNRPRTWRATLPGTVEGAVFAEIIPFHETRDYVKKVLSNATYYAAIFSGQPQSLKQRLGTVSPRVQAVSALP